MRLAAVTLCAIALTGCASNLPYSIAIGTANQNTSLPGSEQCALRLDHLVKEMA